MMGFKEMVAADRARVFLNAAEFGEVHSIEGKRIAVVIDDDELKKRQGGQELAIAESGTLFYARVEDLPVRRAPGSNLNIDGRECLVDDWREDMGVATVILRETVMA